MRLRMLLPLTLARFLILTRSHARAVVVNND